METTKTKSRTSIVGKVFDLFGACYSTDPLIDFSEANKRSIPLGYLLTPAACNESLLAYLKGKKINLDATFYQTWEDVTSKTRWELFIDQVRHYMSTYGTGFTGEAWLPERKITEYEPILGSLKTIDVISKEEVIERCEQMLGSGIALKQETLDSILAIFTAFNHHPDVDRIKNREALMVVCDKLDLLPKSGEEFVRFLIYKASAKTLLIKDRATIQACKDSRLYIGRYLERFGLEHAAAVFHRFKPLFLAFRTEERNRPYINKLRKLADTHHVPYKHKWVETILCSSKLTFEQVKLAGDKLQELTNFKIISLMQALKERRLGLSTRMYPIRNGKVYIQENADIAPHNAVLYQMLYGQLLRNLQEKACKVKLPTNVKLALPATEKSFIGNYPLGTKFQLSDSDCVIGIYWKGEDGARDIDLSGTMLNGGKIGWNARYNHAGQIVYSGDVTSASPDACEMLYINGKEKYPDMLIHVNLYSGNIGAKFQTFLGRHKKAVSRNRMLDDSELEFKVDMELDSHEKCLGLVKDGEFILQSFRTSGKRVSSSASSMALTQHAISTVDKYLDLFDVLTDAGFTFVEEEADLDLTNVSKDTLIKLFS